MCNACSSNTCSRDPYPGIMQLPYHFKGNMEEMEAMWLCWPLMTTADDYSLRLPKQTYCYFGREHLTPRLHSLSLTYLLVIFWLTTASVCPVGWNWPLLTSSLWGPSTDRLTDTHRHTNSHRQLVVFLRQLVWIPPSWLPPHYVTNVCSIHTDPQLIRHERRLQG